VGGVDIKFSDLVEPTVRDHPKRARILIGILESGSLTVSGGQFYWGGILVSGLCNCEIAFELGYMLGHLFL
jgi:hypothetical protein